MKNVLWSSKVWREPWNRFFVGGCKKEHKLCPYGPDQSWRWWPPIMRRFAPTHLLLSSEFQTLSPIRSQSLSTFLLFFFIFFFPFFSCSFFNFVSFWVPAFANNLTPFFYYHFVLFNQDFKTKNKKIRNYFPPTRLNFLDWSNLHNDSVNTFVVSTSRRWTLDSCYFFIFFDLFLGLDDDLRGRKSVVHAELRKRAK